MEQKLSNEEILKLRNRDLDAWIAENIFGWKRYSVGKDAKGENAGEILYDKIPDQEVYNTLPRIGKVHLGWCCPKYTTYLLDAAIFCKKVGYNPVIPLNEIPHLHPQDICLKALEHYLGIAYDVTKQ